VSQDLLAKVLVADPAKRITLDGIYDHKWYLKGLPPGVREMNDRMQPPLDGLQVRARAEARGRAGRRAPLQLDGSRDRMSGSAWAWLLRAASRGLRSLRHPMPLQPNAPSERARLLRPDA
jgi:hypothetical protein